MFDTHKITRSMGQRNQGQGDTSLKVGAVLQNRYLIQGVLGTGGMGAVYKARDMHFPNVTKLVAVKEIINQADPSLREMIVKTFEREANILAELSHPAIPKIYDYFTQGEKSYLVQEFIDGKDLEAYLNDTQDFPAESDVVEWAIQLCDVLSYLHSRQPEPIIFRDMKPSNVMLDVHNRIRLIDFGIARQFSSGQKGTMIGTEGYSPPEQYRGEASPTGDIYALGATLHHLLTRQDPRVEPPFSFSERPVRKANPQVTLELEAVINTSLNYNPNERFPTAQAMKEAMSSMRRARTGVLAPAVLGAPQPLAGMPEAAVIPPPAGAPAAPAVISETLGGEVAPIWSFRCEDELRGSPTFHNGLVFVGCYDNNLYAIKAAGGSLAWKYATDGGLPGTPAVYQDTVFIGSEDRRLHAVSIRSGRVQWTYYTEAPVRSSPRVAEGHVFIGSDDEYLHVVNLQTGRKAWTAPAVGAIRCRPAVAQERVYFGCETGEFYCIDFNGNQKWRFKAKRAVTSSPLLHGGNLYFGSLDGMMYALEAKSGWNVWKFRTNKGVISSPALEANLVYFGSADNNLYAVDIRTGRETWHFEAQGQVNSSPAVANGVVYVGSIDGHVYAVDAISGKLRWRFHAGGPVISSPVVVDGVVYVGALDHNLYALSA